MTPELIVQIVIAVVAILPGIILGLLQLKKWRAEAQETDTKSKVSLVDIALKISQQETETLRGVNSSLKEEISRQDIVIEKKDATIDRYAQRIEYLEKRLGDTIPLKEVEKRNAEREKNFPRKESEDNDNQKD